MKPKTRKPNSSDKTGSGGSSQPAEAPDPDNADAQQQCIDAGGIWTSGVCITAERQCIDAGGIWTGAVCIKN